MLDNSNIFENIWFDGGAWTCAWGAGVIQYLKKHYPDLIFNYKNVGGYSAGGFLAMNVYLNFDEPDFWYCFQHNTHGFGKYHLWAEETANRVWEKDINKKFINDNKISLILYSALNNKIIYKNNWSSKEDFINFTKGTVHIPFMCGFGLHYVDEIGWSLDGGITQREAPKDWERCLTISPWKKSNKNTIGPSKMPPLKLLVAGDFELCKKLFDQGIDDAALWCRKNLI